MGWIKIHDGYESNGVDYFWNGVENGKRLIRGAALNISDAAGHVQGNVLQNGHVVFSRSYTDVHYAKRELLVIAGSSGLFKETT